MSCIASDRTKRVYTNRSLSVCLKAIARALAAVVAVVESHTSGSADEERIKKSSGRISYTM